MFSIPETATKWHAPYRLIEAILALSVADSWQEAKREWELAEVYFADRPGGCLCGHAPIIEQCVIHNHVNGNTAIVGNVCVKRFVGLDSEPIFAGLRRVARDREKALGEAAVEFAYGRGWIDDWEVRFYRDTLRRRRLSPRQQAKRIQINETVLDWATRQPATTEDRTHA